MTANILITTEKKPNIIAVPQGVIIQKGGKKFLKVMEHHALVERQVETGSSSLLGQVEIISGLHDGETVLLNLEK